MAEAEAEAEDEDAVGRSCTCIANAARRGFQCFSRLSLASPTVSVLLPSAACLLPPASLRLQIPKEADPGSMPRVRTIEISGPSAPACEGARDEIMTTLARDAEMRGSGGGGGMGGGMGGMGMGGGMPGGMTITVFIPARS